MGGGGGGGGHKVPALTLKINNFLILQQTPPNFNSVTFPKIYLVMIRYNS